MKKMTLGILFASAVLLGGCATVPMGSGEADQKAKTFAQPSNDKAGLYIFRDSMLGAAITKQIGIDGQVIGLSAPETYFHVYATPGKRALSTQSEFSDNTLEVNLEGGKNHYVRNYIKLGVFVGGANFELVEESEAQKAINESCKLAKPVSDKEIY